MKTIDSEILYGLGIEDFSKRFDLQERKNIFQDAMTNFCDGYHLEDIISWIPKKIRNEELEKGLTRVREKFPRCLGWHFTIAKLLTEPQRSKEMLRIFSEAVPYGDQTGYSSLYYKLKFINEVLEPNRANELGRILSELIRTYCLSVDYLEAELPGTKLFFPKDGFEKVIDMMVSTEKMETIKKVTDNFISKDLLSEAEILTDFLFGKDKNDRISRINTRKHFVKRYQVEYHARMIGS